MRVLGKGLSSLISERDESSARLAHRVESVMERRRDNFDREIVSIERLVPGSLQPRRKFEEEAITELAESISKSGIVQPIIVRPQPQQEGEAEPTYEIIAGERRFRAANMAGISFVPIIRMDIDDKEALEIGLVENIQRQDLTAIEEADGYARLIEEFEYTQEELAEVIGKSRSRVTNTLRLRTLPDEVKNMVDEGILTAGHGRALISAPNPYEAALAVIKKDLNVRQTENLVSKLVNPPAPKKSPPKEATEEDPRQEGAPLKTEHVEEVEEMEQDASPDTDIPPSQQEEFAVAALEEPTVPMIPPGIPDLFNFTPPEEKDPDIVLLEEEISSNIGKLPVLINHHDESGSLMIGYRSFTELNDIIQRLEGKTIFSADK